MDTETLPSEEEVKNVLQLSYLNEELVPEDVGADVGRLLGICQKLIGAYHVILGFLESGTTYGTLLKDPDRKSLLNFVCEKSENSALKISGDQHQQLSSAVSTEFIKKFQESKILDKLIPFKNFYKR